MSGLPEYLSSAATRSISDDLVEAVLAKTLHEHPPETGRWSSRRLASELGIRHRAARRLGRTFALRSDQDLPAPPGHPGACRQRCRRPCRAGAADTLALRLTLQVLVEPLQRAADVRDAILALCEAVSLVGVVVRLDGLAVLLQQLDHLHCLFLRDARVVVT